jgi:hypothetical protein
MNRKNWTVLVLALASLAVIFIAWRLLASSDDWFVEHPMPLQETARLFDVGIVDANGDDRLDIYTSNHHFRQALLIADGQGGYRDVLSEWGLDQSREFPLAELSFVAPKLDQAGAYIYWLGTNLVIRAHRTGEVGGWRGSLRVLDPVKVVKNDGFELEKQEQLIGQRTETTLEFAPKADGILVLTPGGQGLPLHFELAGAVKPEQVFVGLGKVSPPANRFSTRFSLAMQDRHAHVWADYNDDGVLDVFINRGALGGTLKALPQDEARGIKDELFLSRGPGKFEDVAVETGIEKKDCSGRHAQWVDFNGDGLLDLFVNCHDREHVQGNFPKQLYQQDIGKKLRDVAEETGLGLPDQQMGSMVWFDADDDGDADLLAFQDEGLFLYRNREGRFVQETVHRRTPDDAPRISDAVEDDWFVDGKLTVTNYDADGDLDVFFSSKRGNLLLKNQDGKFAVIDPVSVGLPGKSMTANWVDYDNDGLPDLHLVPQGLYRQRQDHTFEKTGWLALHPDQYRAAVVNWFDLDNDGRVDVLMALSPTPSFKHWWEFSKEPIRRGRWPVSTYRNVGAQNHWLQVKLVGASGNREGIGARVTVITPDGMQTREVGASEGSFFSQGHYRLYFGLGTHAKVDAIRVRWSDGVHQELRNVEGDRLITIERKVDQQSNSEKKPHPSRLGS